MTHLLPAPLERAHSWVRSQSWLGRFTLMNRLLLALAFIPTGLVKATGQRFTALPVDNPVGFFFEAMFQTGPYWYFIGFMQLAAGIMLLIPATATIGAVLFVPIVFSIVLITWGIGFAGTKYVTLLMLLAAVYLVCWDADRVWAGMSHLLGRRSSRPLLDGANIAEKVGWVLGAVSAMLLLLTTRGFVPAQWRLHLLVVGCLCFLLVVASWIVELWQGSRSS